MISRSMASGSNSRDGVLEVQSIQPTLAARLGLDPAGLTYADFDQILSGWLESRPVARPQYEWP